MIVYEATKQQFLHDSDNDDIEDVILAHYTAKTGKGGRPLRSCFLERLPRLHGQGPT